MDYVLIDANSIGYAQHDGTKLTVNGFQTQALFGFVRSLRNLVGKYQTASFIVLWDGRAQWRYDMYPEYKSNRDSLKPKEKERKEAYKKQVPLIKYALKHLGITQAFDPDAEADDLAGYFVRHISVDKKKKILLVTGDQDWLQLVKPNVMWFDPRIDLMIGMENFHKSTGYFSPEEFLQGKALLGDTSDKIKGVGGIGKQGAPEFLAQFGSVEEFWKLCESGEHQLKYKAHKSLYNGEGRENFHRNMELMSLLKARDIKIYWTLGKLDKEKFRKLCEEMSFISITKGLDMFFKPFEIRKAYKEQS
jgi:5'-3' exonuclease